MPDLSAQMDAVCHRFEELSVRLNQPDAAADPALFRKLMRDYHETQPVVQAYRDWQTARDHLAQAKALLEEPISDPDFKQMIQQEISEKSQDVAKLENNLKILLLPRDPRDEKNVIMEIRGGAGGEEAALFAHSLLRMYTMYVQSRGWTLELLNLNETELGGVKEAVFPFNMFPEVDPVLGPEMRATGEVMGIADNFGMAYYKAQEAAGCILPTAGKVLVTVSDRDKKFIEPIARDLISLGFTIVSTGGTAEYLRGQGVETEVVNKLHEGRPNLGDMITNKQIDLIINTPVDRTSMIDDSFIRMQSIQKKIPYMTTIAAARATVEGIRSAQHVKVSPRSLQEYHS